MHATDSGERWQVELFDEAAQVSAFMNHVRLRPEQLVDISLHAFSPTIQRIMVTVRLTPEQWALRTEWQAVERVITPPALALATGGGH